MSGLKNVRQRHNDALSRVEWDRFETLLAVYYRGQGYDVEHCGTGGAGRRFDGGIDLKLRRPGEYLLVQCKHWNAKQVPHNDVHQLLGLMLNEDATGGILVTSGEFTAAAKQAALKLGRVRLVEGQELRSMLGPLPEVPFERREDALKSVSDALGKVVAGAKRDQVLIAAGKRLQHHARRAAGDAVQGALVTLGLKLLGAALFVAIGLYLLNSMSNALQAPLARPANPAHATQKVQTATHLPQITAQTSATNDGCREMVDAPSGTYIDHCASSAPKKPPTEEESRELTRKADAAMRVIEASTPEI